MLLYFATLGAQFVIFAMAVGCASSADSKVAMFLAGLCLLLQIVPCFFTLLGILSAGN